MGEMPKVDELMQTLRGFQASRTLLTAVELDVVGACGEGAPAEAVAAAVGADPRATGMLLDALAALGVLAKAGGQYRPTEAGRTLARERTGLMHMVHLWETWSGLTDCVRSGRSGRQGPSGRNVEAFIAAMDSHARALAGDAARLLEAGRVERLLDVGGGPATFAIAFARANPRLRAEVLDLEPVVPIAQGHIRAAGLEDRVTVRAGDLRQDGLGQGWDLVLVSAICHMLDEAENRDLLKRCAAALRPGGRVAIREFILDPDRTGPPAAALFALNMLVGTARGNTYTEAEYRGWLLEAGFTAVTRPVPGRDWMVGVL
jgi:SAM-dependent methyltransferase